MIAFLVFGLALAGLWFSSEKFIDQALKLAITKDNCLFLAISL